MHGETRLACGAECLTRFDFTGAFFTRAELQSIRLYPYTDGLHIFVVAAEVIYFLFVIYYMVEQVGACRKFPLRHTESPTLVNPMKA